MAGAGCVLSQKHAARSEQAFFATAGCNLYLTLDHYTESAPGRRVHGVPLQSEVAPIHEQRSVNRKSAACSGSAGGTANPGSSSTSISSNRDTPAESVNSRV